MRQLILSLTLCMAISACSESGQDIPVLEVNKSAFKIQIDSLGELDAVEATPIGVPRTTSQRQTLSWIMDEHSQVKEGDVVARFDGTTFESELAEANFELQKLDFSLDDKQRELLVSLLGISNETVAVGQELHMADQFNVDNELLYSRLEIIDLLSDKDYLNAQLDYLEQQGDRYQSKSSAEIAVLDTQKSTQLAKLKRNEAGLESLELIAPHDGVFVLRKNWFGQKPQVGQTVYPGFRLGSLPNLSKMKATVYVPEVEALGLKADLKATITLDAYPDRPVTGTIVSISHSAQPRDQQNPVKYFTVEIHLDMADPTWLSPGQRLQASILVAEVDNTVSIPNQAIFQDDAETWVYVKEGSSFKRQPVEVGLRSVTQSEIRSGLNGGEMVALAEPQEA